MDAVIPAAGEGTRLRPLTDDRPKPLVEVRGQPLLAHVFDALAPADPERYVVVIGYRGDDVHERFGDTYRGTPIVYVEQPDPLGLGDAVSRAATVASDEFLVCNGDNVYGGALGDLATAFDDGEVAATMLVEEASLDVARETGVVITDAEGRVQRVVEKPTDPPSTLVSAGANAFGPSIRAALDAIEPSARGEYELADALTWLVDRGHRVETLRYENDRVNVNTPADIERAEAMLGTE